MALKVSYLWVLFYLITSSSVICSVEYGEFHDSHEYLRQDFTLCFRVMFNKMSSRVFEIVSSMGPHQTPSPYRWEIGTVAIPCDVNYKGK